MLYGGDGVDDIRGGEGNDQIYGEAGHDKLFGDDGNDTFYFSSGNNAMDGGAGKDTVDYSASARDTTVNLKTGEGGGAAVGDTYQFIENVVGSQFNDTIWGNAQVNEMNGGAGTDRFFYEQLADISGDTINGFSLAEGDKVDLTRIDDFTMDNISGGGTGGGPFRIDYHGGTVYLTVNSSVSGQQLSRLLVFDA